MHYLALFPDDLLGHFSRAFLSGSGGYRSISMLPILWCPSKHVSASGDSLPNLRLSADPTRFVGVRLLSIGGSRRFSILGSPQDRSDPTMETTSRTRALFSTKRVHRHKRTNCGTSNKLCVEHDGGTKEQRAEDPKVQAPLGVVDCN